MLTLRTVWRSLLVRVSWPLSGEGMRDRLVPSVGPWWGSAFSVLPGVAPGLRPPTLSAPGPLGNPLPTQLKHNTSAPSPSAPPHLDHHWDPHPCHSTITAYSHHFGHLCDSHHKGRGTWWEELKQRGGVGFLILASIPSLIPNPCRSSQEGVLARRPPRFWV